ncbi:MAG: TetR/AcrR family transcriptional regulator [Acidimicrobiia bacterium]
MQSSRPMTARGADDQRYEAVIDAAIACFGRWGVARTRMEDIANEAGIARTILYRHFAGKDELLRAVIVRHIDGRAAKLHSSIPRKGPAGPLILQALLSGITEPSTDHVSESVLGVEIVHDTALLVATSPDVADAMHRYWKPFLEHAEARGELRPGVTISEAVRWLTMLVFYFLTLPEISPTGDQLERYLRTFVVNAIIAVD